MHDKFFLLEKEHKLNARQEVTVLCCCCFKTRYLIQACSTKLKRYRETKEEKKNKHSNATVCRRRFSLNFSNCPAQIMQFAFLINKVWFIQVFFLSIHRYVSIVHYTRCYFDSTDYAKKYNLLHKRQIIMHFVRNEMIAGLSLHYSVICCD